MRGRSEGYVPVTALRAQRARLKNCIEAGEGWMYRWRTVCELFVVCLRVGLRAFIQNQWAAGYGRSLVDDQVKERHRRVSVATLKISHGRGISETGKRAGSDDKKKQG